MTVHQKLRVAYLIPSGIGLGYTGPAVFLKRLISPLLNEISPQIYAGLRDGHSADPQFSPRHSLRVGSGGALRQVAWAVRASLWLCAERREIDVVHFHGTYIYKIFPALVCLALRLPYVLVPLASGADMSLRGRATRIPGVRWLIRQIVGRSTASFALGDEIAEELATAGAPQHSVFKIANPVSEEFFAEPLDMRAAKRTLLFVGVLGPRKRPHLVLEALSLLRERGHDYQAVFLGPFIDEEYRKRFRREIEELGLSASVSHVDFTDDVARVMLHDASLFVLPSEIEGLPGALTEALAAGIPCIVTDAGSMRSTVTAARAGHVTSGAPAEIADLVQRILEDVTEWGVLSANARTYAEDHFRSRAVAEKYLAQVRDRLKR